MKSEQDRDSFQIQAPPFRYYFVVSFLIVIFMGIQDALYRYDGLLRFMNPMNMLGSTLIVFSFFFIFSTCFGIILLSLDRLVLYLLRAHRDFILTFQQKSLKRVEPQGKYTHSHQAESSHCSFESTESTLNSPPKTDQDNPHPCPIEEPSNIERKNIVGKGDFFHPISKFVFYLVAVYIALIYLRLYLSTSISALRRGDSIQNIGVVTIVAFIILIILYFVSFRKRLNYEQISGFIDTIFKPSLIVVALCVISSVATFFFFRGKSAPLLQGKKDGENKPHIIFITIDGLRNSNMSCFGYHRKTTPNIDNFAKRSYSFKYMMSSGTTTHISLMSILTGKYPKQDYPYPDSYSDESMLMCLKANGYEERIFGSQIAGFASEQFTEYTIFCGPNPAERFLKIEESNNLLSWLFQFLSQDERFYNIGHSRDPRDVSFKRADVNMEVYLKDIVSRLKRSSSPAFVWIHFIETHEPYIYPEYYKTKFPPSTNWEIDKYDASINYVDSLFGDFLRKLSIEDLMDKCIIIVSSDHGYVFRIIRPAGYYRPGDITDQFNIPFIIHLPGQSKGKVLRTFASQVDIAPTILDLVGVKIPSSMEGESLVPYMQDENLLSKKVKLNILSTYFFKPEEHPGAGSIDTDIIHVFYDKYIVPFRKKQENSRMGYKKVNKGKGAIPQTVKKVGFDTLVCSGIYNLMDDPDMKINLIDKPEASKILDVIRDSGLLNYY